ncbi:hypothetical protein P280DRAFT_512813 [Massarina eburnea CBS 473.64]|uniref:Uncharacterized protein n=1 Tax=Massarina eburnea CBS 473.64 TaxID=1395130 RepID=A0A6A6SFU7_9PLEO|nr:hypothetical protein P280DRAFT_512813 [Massarina eburnea CBS 473.64]
MSDGTTSSAGDSVPTRYYTPEPYIHAPPSPPPSPLNNARYPQMFTHTHLYRTPISPPKPAPIPNMSSIFTTWGPYNTIEKILASPFYTRIIMPVSPVLAEQWRCSTDATALSAFILHAVHPVPVNHLRRFAFEHLDYLFHYLNDNEYVLGEFDNTMAEKVDRTMKNIIAVSEMRMGRSYERHIGIWELGRNMSGGNVSVGISGEAPSRWWWWRGQERASGSVTSVTEV